MSRRALLVCVGMAGVIVLLAFAASAQPVRLWVVLQSSTGSLDGASPATIVTSEQVPEASPGKDSGLGPLMQLLAVVVVAAGAAALFAMRGWWPSDWPLGGARQRRSGGFGSLPAVADSELGVNIEEARAALSKGQPRNAIVACWMRLEGDIAAAGRPRSGAETSAEYVERIVAEASVDPCAISDLAALYREARFSDHPLGDTDRTRAVEALARVEDSLRFGVGVPS